VPADSVWLTAASVVSAIERRSSGSARIAPLPELRDIRTVAAAEVTSSVGISGVGPDQAYAAAGPVRVPEQRLGGVPVLDGRGGDHQAGQQTDGIGGGAPPAAAGPSSLLSHPRLAFGTVTADPLSPQADRVRFKGAFGG
jgi:hypothetical protein